MNVLYNSFPLSKIEKLFKETCSIPSGLLSNYWQTCAVIPIACVFYFINTTYKKLNFIAILFLLYSLSCLGPIAWLTLGTCSSHSKAHACPCPPNIWCSPSTSTTTSSLYSTSTAINGFTNMSSKYNMYCLFVYETWSQR